MMLYHNRRRVEHFLYAWPFIVGILFIFFASVIDGKLFPVVEKFTITAREEMGDHTLISGYMTKARSCRFIAVDATTLTQTGGREDVPLKFLDNPEDDSFSRPVGAQRWGIWQLLVPKGTNIVTFIAHHECTFMWTTKTELITFIVVK